MTSEIKPEWFEMADADRATQSLSVAKNKMRSANLLAFTAPIMILGAGLVFAQTQTLPIATASAQVAQDRQVPSAASAPSATSDSTTTPPVELATQEVTQSSAASSVEGITPNSAPTPTVSSPSLALPPVSSAATNGDDNDGVSDDDNPGDDNGDDDNETDDD